MKLKCNIKKTAKFIGRLSAKQGFTLIEVLISIFLLVTAVFAIMATTNMIIQENGLNKMRSTAITLAKDKMEILKNSSAVNYTAITGGTDYATVDSVVQTTATGAFYTRTWTITNVTNETPVAFIRKIDVTVTWSWHGINKNVSSTTIVGT